MGRAAARAEHDAGRRGAADRRGEAAPVSSRAGAPAAALLTFLLAFLLYRSTLLPGLDFGDTPSFQVMAGEPVITPRDAYPLYFAIGGLVVRGIGGDPARALNIA